MSGSTRAVPGAEAARAAPPRRARPSRASARLARPVSHLFSPGAQAQRSTFAFTVALSNPRTPDRMFGGTLAAVQALDPNALQMDESGCVKRMDRTQEVAGSSSASSIDGRSRSGYPVSDPLRGHRDELILAAATAA